MRSTSFAAGTHVVTIDETTLRRALWIAGAAAFAVAVVVAGGYVLAAAALGVALAYGVRSYVDNEVRGDFRAPLNESWVAVIEALADNGLVFGEPTWHGVTEGRIRAGAAKVTVELHPGKITRVRIRVGALALPDNRRRAALILESVVKNIHAEQLGAAGA
jgi:hypothetical protein